MLYSQSNMPPLHNSTIEIPSVPLLDVNYPNIVLDGFGILVATVFALLLCFSAFYLTCCGVSEHDRKMYAINHPEETQRTIEDTGLM
jgi:hypothetical protein